ncbi:outer membrane protein [Rhodophyticola porphyridii]|uniref:Porin family protein n=1 Tax=Rhodophyticola porphyridii TaxID=1852017 RepID=A0A3L9Y497_9RHOB|nr:outer membrane beta-barrel protein [Rhodophyticola porphyridii]RMA43634.1 porin family protein [Rhodophyticola porphyridii]
MRIKTLALSTAMLALAAPALASGPVQTTTPPPVTIVPPAPAYDWTGPSVGLQFGQIDVETSGVAALSGDDMLIGIRAYYDYDFGDFIVGGGLQYDTTDVDLGGVTNVDSVLRVGARAGIDLNRNWIYATAGWARVETSAAAVGDSDGYFAGLGYEIFLSQNVTLGAEVLYHEFDDFDLGGLEAEATTAALSLNFRF